MAYLNRNRKIKASGVGGFLKKKQRYEYGLPSSEKEKLLTVVPVQTEAFSEIKAAPHKEIHLPPANLNLSKIPLEDCGIDKVVSSSDSNIVQKKDNIKTDVPINTSMKKIQNYPGDAREQLQKKIAEETQHEAAEAKESATNLKGSGLPEQQEPQRPLKLGMATFEEQLKNVPIHPAVDKHEKSTDPIASSPSTSSAKQSDAAESDNTEGKPEWLQKLWII